MEWKRKHLLGIQELSKEELLYILDTAESFKEVSAREIKKVPALRGQTVVLLFFEPSTRTRISFELAAKRLSADIVNISVSASSVTKGETLLDTVRNIEAMNIDQVVLRHGMSGAPLKLSKAVGPSVINAGDGCHEHPTQALLDIMTIREKKGEVKGLKTVIIGDIMHSRVARSNIWGLVKLGAEVTVCGPPTFIPPFIEATGAKKEYNVDKALDGADVVMPLRIQKERQEKSYIPSLREYAELFGINSRRLALAAPDAILMHPGPINRGVELEPSVAESPQSVILRQVTNGVAVRMAVMYLLSGGGNEN